MAIGVILTMDMKQPMRRVAVSIVLAQATLCLPAVAEPAYRLLLADGTELTAGNIGGWRDGGPLKVAGRSVSDLKNPIRLLRDTRLSPQLRGPRVYFTNGDILPGLVMGYAPPMRVRAQPGGLMVAPQLPLQQMERGSSAIIVRPGRVKRIVLTPTPRGPYRPGTILLTGGKSLSFQAARWRRDTLRLLTEAGARTVKLADIAEIHMPAVDLAREVVNDVLAPSPSLESPIVRITTTNGAVLTFRAAMMISPQFRRRLSHGVQPAWSTQAIEVPQSRVCSYSFRRWNEIPLSLLPAEALAEKSFTGLIRKWRRNSNIRGGRLQCGTIASDLGVGTHSRSAVAFDLPAGAEELTFLVGLDRAVGKGGCAKVKVRRDRDDGKVLWQSGFLRGGDRPVFVGPLKVKGAKRVVLVTNFGHVGRPAGADPGDVRDEVDWLLPTLRVDAKGLLPMTRVPLKDFPGLGEWSVDSGEPTDCRRGARWNGAFQRWDPRVVMNVRPKGMTLTRKVRVTRDTELLHIGATANRETTHNISVRVDDKPLKTTDGAPFFNSLRVAGKHVMTMDGGRRFNTFGRWRSRWWSLRAHMGKQVTLSIRIEPANAKAVVSPLLTLSVALRRQSVIDHSTAGPVLWRYTTTKPPANWRAAAFDDSAWKQGKAMFASKGTRAMGTPWNTRDIWIRRTVEMKPGKFDGLHFLIVNDDAATIYINGRLAATFTAPRHSYYTPPMEEQAFRLLKPGRNVIAVHCDNTGGPGYIDVSIFDPADLAPSPARPVE